MLVFVACDSGAEHELVGLLELVIGGLCEHEVWLFLSMVIVGLLDEWVRDWIVVETCGNFLALLELLYGRTFVELVGGFVLFDVVLFLGCIEDSFWCWFGVLLLDTWWLLFVAAVELFGDLVLVLWVAERFGFGFGVVRFVWEVGLFEIGVCVLLRYFFVCSVVYWDGMFVEHWSVYYVLVESIDVCVDVDCCVWHCAQVAFGFDDDIAVELECSVWCVQVRGGHVVVVVFFEWMVVLNVDFVCCVECAFMAVEAKHWVGVF